MADSTPTRTTVFLTHATPEDNEFGLWLSSKLALAGYHVWVDKRRLRGGDDFWDEIDRVLRDEAIKQVVVFTQHTKKAGVKKELAIGDTIRGCLGDPKFMIAILADDIPFGDAPPEFIRGNILNAYPHWHDCLAELFEALAEEGVPRAPNMPDADSLAAIVAAREDGRRAVIDRPESGITNWFPITPPERIRYYRFEGLRIQMDAWLKDCRVPHVITGRLVGTFADPTAIAGSSSFDQRTPTAYDISFADVITRREAGPRDQGKAGAINDIVSLLRQHFAQLAQERGLLRVEFANKEEGWFFPDDLDPGGKVTFSTEGCQRIQRTMSDKFKALRWHVCLVARPRIWPSLVYRIHANVVLSRDGRTPLPGDSTHKRRRRLTRSWWNDLWRDRLVAAMRYLAAGEQQITLVAGNEQFSLATWPMEVVVPVSYDAILPCRVKRTRRATSRRQPLTLSAAALKLAAQTGCDAVHCQSRIQSMLILMSKPASERGGNSDRVFLAFKLHQFFSGAGRLYSTLREPGRRRVTLDGQLFDPDDQEARLYPTFFCRNCGQEHHPIVLRRRAK